MKEAGRQWMISSADSSKQAFVALSKQPTDVIVMDIHLPDTTGPKFLKELSNKYPGAVRLVLASALDQEIILESAGMAHQFLAKPCNPAQLRSVIESTSSLGDRLANEKVKRLVSKVERLPTVPALYKKICSLLESESSTTDQIGRYISRDPGMSANVLKLVNSAYFSLRRSVSDPCEAVAYIGIDALKALVLATGLFENVGKFEVSSFNVGHLWNHTLAVAFGAKEIAHTERAGGTVEIECFTSGLMHDAGILILASQFPKEYQKIDALIEKEGMTLSAAELKIFDVTHGDVGAYLMGLWGLPSRIVDAVAWHHNPCFEVAKSFTPTVAVHASDAITGPTHHAIFSTSNLDMLYLQSLGLAGKVDAWKGVITSHA
jgi:HD-like signal output (HDOD) protein